MTVSTWAFSFATAVVHADRAEEQLEYSACVRQNSDGGLASRAPGEWTLGLLTNLHTCNRLLKGCEGPYDAARKC